MNRVTSLITHPSTAANTSASAESCWRHYTNTHTVANASPSAGTLCHIALVSPPSPQGVSGLSRPQIRTSPPVGIQLSILLVTEFATDKINNIVNVNHYNNIVYWRNKKNIILIFLLKKLIFFLVLEISSCQLWLNLIHVFKTTVTNFLI